ncbi:MBL fold metallo-hydrolase [Corynebacterium sp. H130]|uniref:MBL fold metallo-hydrolase n=2 Tax=Corynebacterium sp. H130 TaxID=3133444 RepID=UPI003099CFF3
MPKAAVPLFISATLLAGCSATTEQAMSPAELKNKNESLQILPRFGSEPQVLSDPDGSGALAAQKIFEKSDTAIIAGPEMAAQARAASISVATHSPMMTSTPETVDDVVAALGALNVTHVLMVGEATPLEQQGLTVVTDPGTPEGLGELTSLKFERVPTNDLVADIAKVDPVKRIEYTVPGNVLAQRKTVTEHFPVQGKQDGGAAPPIIATRTSSVASVATARAFGANVTVLEHADPRYSDATVKATAGLEGQPILALGDDFGTSEELTRRIRSAQTAPQQIGGGGLVFPGRRMVALYGHPSGPALGVMGEMPPKEAAAEAKKRAAEYQPYSPEPVIPAFEIIATVAASQPGGDGDYSNESTVEELTPYVDAMTEAGGYVFLDLQPGRASLLEQAKRYEELLKRPNVGLALDPEWKLGPEGKPLQDVGHVDAAEVNEVSNWLATVTKENNLPQKPLIVHQFQEQMIRNRDQLAYHDELAMVIHVDGHGTEAEKMQTWDMVRAGLDPRIFLAWKNFHDEDKPMFSPEQTMETDPKPWLVTFQ